MRLIKVRRRGVRGGRNIERRERDEVRIVPARTEGKRTVPIKKMKRRDRSVRKKLRKLET